MLVLISDLHLTDERVARNVNPEAFRLFESEVAQDGESFASSTQMVYVYLYRADEDGEGKQPGTSSMDIWTGIRRKVYA